MTTASILSDIGGAGAGQGCNYDEKLSGMGTNLYAVDPEWLIKRPAYGKNGSANYQSFSFDASNFYKGKYALKFHIKKSTGQNQGQGVEGPKGFTQTLAFTIEKDIKRASEVLRAIKNHEDYYFLCETAEANVFEVVGDPVFGSRLNFNYDGGTTPDSDSGCMATVTSNSMRAVAYWTPSTTKQTWDDDEATELKGVLPTSTNPSESTQVMPGDTQVTE